MTTADEVREKAISLARGEAPTDDAIRDLLECCTERRVPVVLARQQFEKDLAARPADPVVSKAAELLDGVLERIPVN